MDGLCPSCISLIETQDETNAFTNFERGRAGYRRTTTAEKHGGGTVPMEENQTKRVCARALYAHTILLLYLYIPNTLKRQTARILPPSF